MAKITSDDIRKALELRYTTPEWYLGFEVGNSTGANCRRHADAVAINAYPSKGFMVMGFEIKVSKQDLKAELENGIKSDEIARFCDYWFLVVPKGLADGFALPPTWGVIEYADGNLRQKVCGEKLDKVSPTIGFLCAMLRGRERAVLSAAGNVTKDHEEQIKRSALWGIKNAEQDLAKLRERLNEVKKATGISLDDWAPTREIIDRLNAAKSLNLIGRNVRFLKNQVKILMEGAQEIQSAVDAIYADELKEAE